MLTVSQAYKTVRTSISRDGRLPKRHQGCLDYPESGAGGKNGEDEHANLNAVYSWRQMIARTR